MTAVVTPIRPADREQPVAVKWTPQTQVLFVQLWNSGVPVDEIARRFGYTSKQAVYYRAHTTPGCVARPRGRQRIATVIPEGMAPTPAPTASPARQHIQPGDTTLRRFGTRKAAPEHVLPLKPDSDAIQNGRSQFPNTVVSARETPRILVTGHNNRKIGKEVQKGPWAGMPIFMVTLEERATCPRSCWLYSSCYGNAMHLARRHEHGDEFEQRLELELRLKAIEHPDGFVVRLHVLGDFYSVAYVRFWERMLRVLPQLRVWGYTANDSHSADEKERAIALELQRVKFAYDRFAIRWSRRTSVPGGSTVIDYVPEAPRVPEGLVCPAQTEATACCATCGLCWAPAARAETIVFIKHGRLPHGARETGE